jgi:hypothetical protein
MEREALRGFCIVERCTCGRRLRRFEVGWGHVFYTATFRFRASHASPGKYEYITRSPFGPFRYFFLPSSHFCLCEEFEKVSTRATCPGPRIKDATSVCLVEIENVPPQVYVFEKMEVADAWCWVRKGSSCCSCEHVSGTVVHMSRSWLFVQAFVAGRVYEPLLPPLVLFIETPTVFLETKIHYINYHVMSQKCLRTLRMSCEQEK